MNPKKKALTVATAGTLLGLGGLGLTAIPAGAGESPPELPAISAEKLVSSTLNAETPALNGTVEVDNNLGLPAMPSMPGMPSLNFESANVYYNGDGKGRIAVHDGPNEFTMVYEGDTVWTYNSAQNQARKVVLPAGHDSAKAAPGKAEFADPAKAATALLSKARESSTISVDGTARVGERPAYELVLTPKPSEKTLLRTVRVAIDYETRLPLRLSVMVNGTTEPAVSIGFSEIEFGQQPADRFRFSPPQDAEVTVEKPDPAAAKEARKSMRGLQDIEVVGNGWDTVVTGKLPAGALSGAQSTPGSDEREFDPRKLLEQVAKPVSGPFGKGHVLSLNGATVLITEDGRVAGGAVPQQVLVQALGNE